jgi:hypothetical protein
VAVWEWPFAANVTFSPSSLRCLVQRSQSGNASSVGAPARRGETRTETGSVGLSIAMPRAIAVNMMVWVGLAMIYPPQA